MIALETKNRPVRKGGFECEPEVASTRIAFEKPCDFPRRVSRIRTSGIVRSPQKPMKVGAAPYGAPCGNRGCVSRSLVRKRDADPAA